MKGRLSFLSKIVPLCDQDVGVAGTDVWHIR